jgi:acyl-coenzyme A synthetase/AMP-(fatty) acid ligase
VQARLCPKVTFDYGATETGVIACGNYNVLLDVPDAVGFPVPGAIVEIVDENDQPLPAGQDGRVRCRTSYFVNAIAANFLDRANAINDLWWYPGDFGHLTDDSILCVKGRADDVTNVSGVKVSGEALDEAVRQCPGVKDAGVCAVRGQSGIEEAWIGIVADDEFDLANIKNVLRENKDFGIEPGEIFVVDQIPRNDLGKLQRHKLKEMLIGLRNY